MRSRECAARWSHVTREPPGIPCPFDGVVTKNPDVFANVPKPDGFGTPKNSVQTGLFGASLQHLGSDGFWHVGETGKRRLLAVEDVRRARVGYRGSGTRRRSLFGNVKTSADVSKSRNGYAEWAIRQTIYPPDGRALRLNRSAPSGWASKDHRTGRPGDFQPSMFAPPTSHPMALTSPICLRWTSHRQSGRRTPFETAMFS